MKISRTYKFYLRTIKLLDLISETLEINKTVCIEMLIRNFYNEMKERIKIKKDK